MQPQHKYLKQVCRIFHSGAARADDVVDVLASMLSSTAYSGELAACVLSAKYHGRQPLSGALDNAVHLFTKYTALPSQGLSFALYLRSCQGWGGHGLRKVPLYWLKGRDE